MREDGTMGKLYPPLGHLPRPKQFKKLNLISGLFPNEYDIMKNLE